ncbi:hypothetical protein BDY21DRAFT_339361 [Lineolata rhizophorae]|uniref:DUF2293 domain-containing protein n=1 Tax=Lineolata rhizophorae TaxID=578093 RepID=A0A6A6P4M2_9PEZI|nr:hypothetical protein BDY21DRAFT_339361 [Lineolata rhizophorae]
MGRVGKQAATTYDRRSSSRQTLANRKKPYKVVLEQVAQEKRRFRFKTTRTRKAPANYTYVPVGEAELIAYAKEICRINNFLFWAVSKSSNPDNVTSHVRRVGWHFPSNVLEYARDVLRYVQIPDSSPKQGEGSEEINKHELWVDVNKAMMECFPEMPKEIAESIIRYAWEDGSSRVGVAGEMSLHARVQMAAVAYVRHRCTPYDKLLKDVSWHRAREIVQPACIALIQEWRGEGNRKEFEEAFKEVIYLDSDDTEYVDNTSDDGSDDSEINEDVNGGAPGEKNNSGRKSGEEINPSRLEVGSRSENTDVLSARNDKVGRTRAMQRESHRDNARTRSPRDEAGCGHRSSIPVPPWRRVSHPPVAIVYSPIHHSPGAPYPEPFGRPPIQYYAEQPAAGYYQPQWNYIQGRFNEERVQHTAPLRRLPSENEIVPSIETDHPIPN